MSIIAMGLISTELMPNLLYLSILISWDANVEDHLHNFISNTHQILVPDELFTKRTQFDLKLY